MEKENITVIDGVEYTDSDLDGYPGVIPPQKGDPIIDIMALRKYRKDNNLEFDKEVPEEIVKKFIIGYVE
ncbi:MAG: hypothetical protein ACOX7B_08025 [Christensenellales bacterium]